MHGLHRFNVLRNGIVFVVYSRRSTALAHISQPRSAARTCAGHVNFACPDITELIEGELTCAYL